MCWIIHVKLILPPQMRQEILNRLTKKISKSDLEQTETLINEYKYINNILKKIKIVGYKKIKIIFFSIL